MIEPSAEIPKEIGAKHPSLMSEFDSCAVERELQSRGIPARVFYFPSTPSTMLVDRLSAEEGVSIEPWQVYCAGLQVDGRGLTGPWKKGIHDAGFTFIVPEATSKREHMLLRVAAGLGVVNALEEYACSPHPDLYVKWPNDVLHGTKKIAGILNQGTFENIGFSIPEGLRFIGVGINLADEVLSVDALRLGKPVVLREIATSLETLQPEAPIIRPEAVIASMITSYARLDRLVRSEEDKFLHEVNDHFNRQRGKVFIFEFNDGTTQHAEIGDVIPEGILMKLDQRGAIALARFEDLRKFYLPGAQDI